MIKYIFVATLVFSMSILSLRAEDNTSNSLSTTSQELCYDQLYSLFEKSYVFVDLGLSEHELSVLDQLQIEDSADYNRYADLQLLKKELPGLLKDIGNSDAQLIAEVTQIIERLVSRIVTAAGKETAWVCLRAAPPNSTGDIPRWHIDGSYYSPHFMPQYKFAAALKGNGTLFYPLTPSSRAVYLDLASQIKLSNIDDPEELKDYFKQVEDQRVTLSHIFNVKQAESASRGYGAFFVVGHVAFSALHSEPKFDIPRLFISILPGREGEIKELADSQNSRVIQLP